MSGTPVQFEGEWFVRLVLDKKLNHPPPFILGGPHALEVEISPIDDEKKRTEHPDCMRCVVRGRWTATEKLMAALESMSRGLLPDGRHPEPAWEEFTTALMNRPLVPGTTRSYSIEDLYPEHVRAFVRGVQAELREAALKILS